MAAGTRHPGRRRGNTRLSAPQGAAPARPVTVVTGATCYAKSVYFNIVVAKATAKERYR